MEQKIKELLLKQNGHIDLTENNISLFDDNTEKQTGESFEVLGVTSGDEEIWLNMGNGDVWGWGDLTEYEQKLILDACTPKKAYVVDMDITVSKRVYVEAESEEEAMRLAKEEVDSDPYHYAWNCDAYVSSQAIDANEDNE